MPWLQLRISAQRDAVPSIESALLTQGALSVTFEDSADEPIFEPALGETPLWQDTRITGLFEADGDTKAILQNIVEGCRLDASTCQWQILEDKEWEREWMNNYHPIQCADNFWICPSWTPPPNPDAVNLKLDPGLAFGTGTHPTTFLCLQWAAHANLRDKTVVDYGCGSGILGIAALLLGASSVTGTDIDPQALLATAENVERNNLKAEQFPVFFPDKCPIEKVDIVFANILAGPLVELAPALTGLMKPGGKICLSGILNTQRETIVDAYSSVIHIDEISEHDNWLCITGTKN
ncbi:MAG: 50S ribosomal protein L11 methyltransferase [Agarilytica sp.]